MAAAFATQRTPLSGGSSRHTRSDTLHPRLFIEVKERARHALYTLYRQTSQLARGEGKVPVVAICETGRQGFLVACHVDDLQAVARELAADGQQED